MVKHFIILATFALSSVYAFAQDVILKKDGSEINAKVVELTEQHVKYKDFDFQNGPTRNINISDVFMITYENGKKEVFNKQTSTPTPTTPEKEVVNEQTSIPTLVTVQPSVQSNEGEVYIKGGRWRYRSNNQKVTNMEELFYDMPEAAKMYRSGKTWTAVGWGIWGVGLTISFIDVFYHSNDNLNNPYNPTYFYQCPVYWIGLGVGSVGLAVFNGIGGAKQRMAIDLYNATVRRQQASKISMNFGVTRSGNIGLILNF
jgi:hypothetical protein